MSQIYIAGTGSGPVTGVETLTGNTGGAVGPDGSNNINVVGDGNTITVTGDPGTNTLTISQMNSVVLEATTTDDTPLEVTTVEVDNNTAIRITVTFIAAYSTFVDALSATQSILAVRTGSTLSLSDQGGDEFYTENVPVGVGLTFTDVGDVAINLTGAAATTINWKLYISWITYP